MNREAERKRLVELIGSKICEDYSPTCDEYKPHTCEKCFANNCSIGELADHILDDGWMRPPVKLGDVVYALWETPTLYTEAKYVLYSAEVKEVSQCERNNRVVLIYKLEPTSFRGRIREFFEYDFGKTVFTSREDAEKALKGVGRSEISIDKHTTEMV